MKRAASRFTASTLWNNSSALGYKGNIEKALVEHEPGEARGGARHPPAGRGRSAGGLAAGVFEAATNNAGRPVAAVTVSAYVCGLVPVEVVTVTLRAPVGRTVR